MRKHLALTLVLLLASCGNPKLNQARRELDQSFQAFLALSGTYQQQFVAMQSAWLNSADTICRHGPAVKDQTACLIKEYAARADYYRSETAAYGVFQRPSSTIKWDHELPTFLATDAFSLIPFAPDRVLPIFRAMNDNSVAINLDPSSDVPLWGEILALRYEMPPSAANLQRITALMKRRSELKPYSSTTLCMDYDEPGCGSPGFSKVGWLLNGLTSNRTGLLLPCRLVAAHPELMIAIKNSSRFGVSTSCDPNDFPVPESIVAFEAAIYPFLADPTTRCGADSVRNIDAQTAQYSVEAELLPRSLLPTQASSAGQNKPQTFIGWGGGSQVFGTAAPVPRFAPPHSNFAEYGTEHPLEAWSYQSVANRRSYLRIDRLFRQAVTDLASYYHDRFDLPNADARAAAGIAISGMADWTFIGSPSPLAVAIMRKDAKPDLATLLAAHATITGTDEPALSLAADRPSAIALLLRNGATPNETNNFGKTALMTAAQFDDAQSVTLLLKAGAEINSQSLAPLAIPGNDPTGSQCGTLAIKHGQRSALMYAASNASLALIRQLLAAGANVALRDSTGLTARDYLQGRGPVPRNPNLSPADYGVASRLLDVSPNPAPPKPPTKPPPP